MSGDNLLKYLSKYKTCNLQCVNACWVCWPINMDLSRIKFMCTWINMLSDSSIKACLCRAKSQRFALFVSAWVHRCWACKDLTCDTILLYLQPRADPQQWVSTDRGNRWSEWTDERSAGKRGGKKKRLVIILRSWVGDLQCSMTLAFTVVSH